VIGQIFVYSRVKTSETNGSGLFENIVRC